jgi:hypothetical protein
MAEANGNGAVAPQGKDKRGRFLPGHRSTGGRKVGSRNRLSESFLADLHAEWKKSGKKVLARVAETAPETFLRCVATVLPKALEVDGALNVTHRTELAVEIADFASAYEKWGRYIGANMPMIEDRTEYDETETDDDDQSGNGR